MGNRSRTGAVAAIAAGLISTATVQATPATNDKTEAQGCISVNGGKGVFDIAATFTLSNLAVSGTLAYADTGAGFQVTSTNLVDYTYMDPNMRGFIFSLSGGVFDQARVFVTDYGDSGDRFLIQLLSAGNIVYEAGGLLTTDCGGGVEIVPEDTPPPPPPTKPGKRVGQTRPKGNNGVGNGIDPQPPGNPPINDGPGTGPGNPGNRQLGRRGR